MKKFLIISLLALVCSGSLHAQEPGQWTANASAAYVGNLSWVRAGEGLATALVEVFATVFTLGLYQPGSNSYARPDDVELPAFALQAGYQALPWLQVTGDLYYDYYHANEYKNEEDTTPGRVSYVNRFAFLPGVKFTYLNKGIFHMYSSVALGAGYRFGQRDASGEVTPISHLGFAVQTTPVGFAFGNDFYGFLDVGCGTEYIGLRLGAGYNF